MKTKVTNKQIRKTFYFIYSLGYCELPELFNTITPFAYNCGVYGWNCDFYEIDNVCISTGYRTIGKGIDYKIIDKYRNKIKCIKRDVKNYDEKQELFNELLHEFIKELKVIKI